MNRTFNYGTENIEYAKLSIVETAQSSLGK